MRQFVFLTVIITMLIAGSARADAGQVTLSLSPATQTVAVGETFAIDIFLDTGGYATDGVDIHFLHYDPQVLEVQDSVSSTPFFGMEF